MKIYLIHLELNAGSDTLGKISGVLNGYNGIRYQKDAWMILADDTALGIREKLTPLLSSSEYVMVAKLEDDFSMKQPSNIERWLRRNMSI